MPALVHFCASTTGTRQTQRVDIQVVSCPKTAAFVEVDRKDLFRNNDKCRSCRAQRSISRGVVIETVVSTGLLTHARCFAALCMTEPNSGTSLKTNCAELLHKQRADALVRNHVADGRGKERSQRNNANFLVFLPQRNGVGRNQLGEGRGPNAVVRRAAE